MNKIRIYQLIYTFAVEAGGGGIGRFAIALSRALDKRKFEVTIGALFDMGTSYEVRWREELMQAGIGTCVASEYQAHKPYHSFRTAMHGLRHELSKIGVDIIHSHSEFSDVAALLLRYQLAQKPVIMRTIHNGYKVEWRRRPMRRLVFSNILFPLVYHAEIGVSQGVVENLDRRWLARILRKRATCLHNAIDLNRFTGIESSREAMRQQLSIPEGAFLVGSIGRLRIEKGYDTLIEATAMLTRKLPQTYLVIVGDGELAESLQALVREREIAERILFTGAITEIERTLSAFDLFVSSSLWEGLPTAILESMAAGVPVVATDISGTRELISAGRNGWLVPPGDANALAEAMHTAYLESQMRREFRLRSLEDVKGFTIELVARQHELLYEKAFQKRS